MSQYQRGLRRGAPEAAPPPRRVRRPARASPGTGVPAPRKSARRCPSECRSGSGPPGRRSGSSVPASGAASPPRCGPPDRAARSNVAASRPNTSIAMVRPFSRSARPARVSSTMYSRKRRLRAEASKPGLARIRSSASRTLAAFIAPPGLPRPHGEMQPTSSATAWMTHLMTRKIPCNSPARHGSNPDSRDRPSCRLPVASLEAPSHRPGQHVSSSLQATCVLASSHGLRSTPSRPQGRGSIGQR